MVATLTAIAAALDDIITKVPLVITALGDLDTFLATL
jgi:hypothetical protein